MTRFGCVRSSACGENLRALELRPDPGILTPAFMWTFERRVEWKSRGLRGW
jgi:hypothetical protein